jgi:DegV family protein with EDD domain
MQVKIIADSTCDLPNELIKQLDIDIVPLYVIMDDVSYKDGLEITPKKLIEWSDKTKKVPKTSAPSVEDFTKIFRPYAARGREAVFISVSSELSATFQNAFFAVNSLDNANIKVVDSKNVSVGTGILVLKAANMARQGKSPYEITKALDEIIPKISASFIFDNLEFLKRGGRCSAAKALAAGALKIRPRIDAVEGKLVPVEKYRGSLEKTVKKFCESIKSGMDKAEREYCIIGSTRDDYGLLTLLEEEIVNLGYFETILKANPGSIITAHSGPNTYAIIYIKE